MRGTRTISIAIVAAAAPLIGGCASATGAQHEDQQTDTARKVKEAVVEILRIAPGKIVPGARFVEDLGADSLDCVEIVMGLEEKFGIAIADADVSNLKTVGDANVYVDRRRRARR